MRRHFFEAFLFCDGNARFFPEPCSKGSAPPLRCRFGFHAVGTARHLSAPPGSVGGLACLPFQALGNLGSAFCYPPRVRWFRVRGAAWGWGWGESCGPPCAVLERRSLQQCRLCCAWGRAGCTQVGGVLSLRSGVWWPRHTGAALVVRGGDVRDL